MVYYNGMQFDIFDAFNGENFWNYYLYFDVQDSVRMYISANIMRSHFKRFFFFGQ